MLDWPPDGTHRHVRLWTLRRRDESVACELLRYHDGRHELAILCGRGGSLQQTYRVPAESPARAEQLRDSFTAFGFVDVPELARLQ